MEQSNRIDWVTKNMFSSDNEAKSFVNLYFNPNNLPTVPDGQRRRDWVEKYGKDSIGVILTKKE